VQSGTSETGPFDNRRPNRRPQRSQDDDAQGGATSRRPTAPRRVEPDPQPTGGIELVPQPKDQSFSDDDAETEDIGWEDVPEFVATDDIDVSVPPLLVGLEPSVGSRRPGQETVLQVIVRGGTGAYRLPVGLSYDPSRVWVYDVLPGPGVEILHESIDQTRGWISLEIVVTSAIEAGQAVAALQVQALDPGPVPLVFSTNGAVSANGTAMPVAASDGALFVNGYGQVTEEP
jgi:hypothetical protein